MTETFTLDREQLFEEICERGKMEMIVTKEAYDMLVEEVIEEHVDLDELDIDQDTEGLESHLKECWGEYQRRLAE